MRITLRHKLCDAAELTFGYTFAATSKRRRIL